jgi:hypothetical protein
MVKTLNSETDSKKPEWQKRWERERTTTVEGLPIKIDPPAQEEPEWYLYQRNGDTKIFFKGVSFLIIPLSIIFPLFMLFEILWHGMWKHLGLLLLSAVLVAMVQEISGPMSNTAAYIQLGLTVLLFCFYHATRKAAIKRDLERKNWKVIGTSRADNKKAAIEEWGRLGLMPKSKTKV